MLNIVNVGYDSTNYYVIETTGTRLLIDVGFPGTLPKFRHALHRTGIAQADIAYLLVTHFHPDHAGLAEELSRQGIRPIVLEPQLPFIPLLQGMLKPPHRDRDITLERAITISLAESRAFLRRIGVAGEVIATLGHSDDSVTLVLDAGLAFTGDLPPDAMTDDAHPAIRESWAAIRAHNVHTIYPGHGPVYPLAAQVAC